MGKPITINPELLALLNHADSAAVVPDNYFDAAWWAARLGVAENTAASQLRKLFTDGRIRRVKVHGKMYYENAVVACAGGRSLRPARPA